MEHVNINSPDPDENTPLIRSQESVKSDIVIRKHKGESLSFMDRTKLKGRSRD